MRSPWRLEAGALTALALPMIAGNIAWAGIAATDLLLVNLRTQFGPEWGAAYSLLRATVFIFSCGTWLYYVVAAEPAPVMLPSMAQARPILQRWNEAALVA